ncbi:hypothetical protein VTN96DRAFT_4122 [Rasamsonia emersonii]
MSLAGNRGVRTAAVRQTRVICRHSLLFLYPEAGICLEEDQKSDVGITTLPSSGTAALTNPIHNPDIASVA